MNAAADSTTLNTAIADSFRGWTSSFIARRLQTVPERTIENWKQGRAAPQARHLPAILSDELLGPAFLKAVGCADLADLVTARRSLLAAKAALDGIR